MDYLILTDSNIDLLKLFQNKEAESIFDVSLSYGFLNTITRATRIYNKSFSLIDQIFLKSDQKSIKSGVLLSDVSDHFFFTFIELNRQKVNTKSTSSSRSFSNTNILKFRTHISSLSWDEILVEDNPETAFNLFWDKFYDLFELNFSIKTRHFSRNRSSLQGFMTSGILISRRHKLTLHKKSLAHPTPSNKSNCKLYRNAYNKIIRAAKKTLL